MAEHVLQKEHAEILTSYLRFLTRKREGCISEVVAEFKELRESRLFEEEYSRDDVEALLDGLLTVCRSTMKKDLQTSMFSSVLLLKQALEQAEKVNLNVELDLPATEDRYLLSEVEAWDQAVQDGHSAELRARAAIATKTAGTGLGSIDKHAANQNLKLAQQLQAMEDSNVDLGTKYDRLKEQMSNSLKENAALREQLDALSATISSNGGEEAAKDDAIRVLRDQVADLQADLEAARDATEAAQAHSDQLTNELATANEVAQANADLANELAAKAGGFEAASMSHDEFPKRGSFEAVAESDPGLLAELDGAQARVSELSDEVEMLRREMEERVEKSTQFSNMRQMLAKKNQLVKSLRDQLAANGIAYSEDVEAHD